MKLDGAPLTPALWGVAAPVDPGEHAIEVVAKGRKPWSTRVQVALPNEPTVRVPELELAPADVKAKEEAAPSANAQRSVALVVGGVGVVGIAVGTVFGLSAKSTYYQGDGECNESNVCSAEGTDLRNSAYGKATISTIGFSVGGAALVSAVVLWITAPRSKEGAHPRWRSRSPLPFRMHRRPSG